MLDAIIIDLCAHCKLDIANLLRYDADMKLPKRHTITEWLALWSRIEAYGIRKLAAYLGTDIGIIRGWKSRGAIPEIYWYRTASQIGVDVSVIVGKFVRAKKGARNGH